MVVSVGLVSAYPLNIGLVCVGVKRISMRHSTGRATCIRCDHRWFMSEDELRRDGILRQTPYPGEEE